MVKPILPQPHFQALLVQLVSQDSKVCVALKECMTIGCGESVLLRVETCSSLNEVREVHPGKGGRGVPLAHHKAFARPQQPEEIPLPTPFLISEEVGVP